MRTKRPLGVVALLACIGGIACSSRATPAVAEKGAGEPTEAEETGTEDDSPRSRASAAALDAGSDAARTPQSDGAPCSSSSDCVDRQCSPVTKTCGGCFADGAECGAALECCSGTCNPDGVCGIVRKRVGEACNLAKGVKCVSGAYCNRAQTCEKGCNVDSDCAKGEECGDGVAPDTLGVTGSCFKPCLAGDAECTSTAYGRLCDPYNLGSGRCGCKTYKDCPAGRACISSECFLDSP